MEIPYRTQGMKLFHKYKTEDELYIEYIPDYSSKKNDQELPDKLGKFRLEKTLMDTQDKNMLVKYVKE